MMTRAALAAMVAVPILFVASGCDDYHAGIGISFDRGSSEMRLYVALCPPDDRLVEVTLRDHHTDEILWRIRSAEARTAADFLVGHVPEGFEEIEPYAGNLHGQDQIRAEATVVRGDQVFTIREEYRVSRLKADRIRARGDLLDAEEWADHVADRCAPPSRGLLGRLFGDDSPGR